MKTKTLKAGTIVQLHGIPVELVSATTVKTASGNWETMSAINQDRAITNHICKVKGVEDLHPVWQREDYAGPGFYVISDGTYEMTGPFAEYESAKVEAEDQIDSGEINNEELV